MAQGTSESIDFIGFSSNEQLAAVVYSYTIAAAKDPTTDSGVDAQTTGGAAGLVDRFSVIQVVTTDGSGTVAYFKKGALTRHNSRGRRIPISDREIKRRYPAYVKAHSQKQWKRVARRANFRKKRLKMGDSVFRLAGGNRFEAIAEMHHMELMAPPEEPLIFEPMIRLMNGRMVSAGTFRESSRDKSKLGAKLRAYFSRTGRNMVVLAKFRHYKQDHAIAARDRLTLMHFDDAPVGTTEIGVWRMTSESLQAGRQFYEELHPGFGEHYDKYVGTHW